MHDSDLKIARGAIFDVDFTLYEDDQLTELTDLTNKRAILQLSDRRSIYLRIDTDTDPTDTIAVDTLLGTISVHLNRSHTLRLLSDCKYYLVIVDETDADQVEPVAEGNVVVEVFPVEL